MTEQDMNFVEDESAVLFSNTNLAQVLIFASRLALCDDTEYADVTKYLRGILETGPRFVSDLTQFIGINRAEVVAKLGESHARAVAQGFKNSAIEECLVFIKGVFVKIPDGADYYGLSICAVEMIYYQQLSERNTDFDSRNLMLLAGYVRETVANIGL